MNATTQHPLNILLIDDSRTARLVLKTQMESMTSDVSVHCVDPAKHGLPGDDFDWSEVDHVVINQNLGNHTGLAWYQHYSTHRPLPSTTLISGTHSKSLEAAAKRAGMDGLIIKNAMAATQLMQSIQASRRMMH